MTPDDLQQQFEGGQVSSLSMVSVCNRNNFTLEDRHDGVPYKFTPNVALSIPPQAAAHFFAWPAERDVRVMHMSRRYAWNRVTEDMEFLQPDSATPNDRRNLAEKYVDNFHIETQTFDLVPRVIQEAPHDPELDTMSQVTHPGVFAPAPNVTSPDEYGSTRAGKRSPPPKRL